MSNLNSYAINCRTPVLPKVAEATQIGAVVVIIFMVGGNGVGVCDLFATHVDHVCLSRSEVHGKSEEGGANEPRLRSKAETPGRIQARAFGAGRSPGATLGVEGNGRPNLPSV